MLFIFSASVNIGQVLGYSVLFAVSATAGSVAWILSDGRRWRCPRCGASTRRFARRCRRCEREISPTAVAKCRNSKKRRILAVEMTSAVVFAVGWLALVLASPSEPGPLPLANHRPPSPAVAPPPLAAQVQHGDRRKDAWPIGDETKPPGADPLFVSWVDASKAQAILAHPDLGVPGSVFQTTLIARYQELFRARNRRLDDPRWPQELANEVALQLANDPRRAAQP